MKEKLLCRLGGNWLCDLYKIEGDKNLVSDKTCELCMKARAINSSEAALRSLVDGYSELDTAVRTLNQYTGRLQRALEKLEKQGDKA